MDVDTGQQSGLGWVTLNPNEPDRLPHHNNRSAPVAGIDRLSIPFAGFFAVSKFLLSHFPAGHTELGVADDILELHLEL